MIVSVHVPKTGGTSFKSLLERAYGQRLLLDYGDWAGFTTPEAIARRAHRREEMRGRRDRLIANFDVIHGHFIADKYSGLFPESVFAAFFRDPYQQALSNYYYLQGNPDGEHPAIKAFHREKMSLHDYVAWEATANPQTQLLGTVALADFAFIGTTEEFERGIALFNNLFAKNLGVAEPMNVNPGRSTQAYAISPDLHRLISKHRAADIELYAKAKEAFAALAARHGV
jgi:hypothetical protein